MSDQDTVEILMMLHDEGILVTKVKEWICSTGTVQEILHDVMQLPDEGKILVLVDKAMWYCWIIPCVFGATETINYDHAYATGKYSALHEARHLFGWRDII